MKTFNQFLKESASTRTAKVYHGGDLNSGRKPIVTYWTPNLEMARSYLVMTRDRFGGDPQIHSKELTLKVPTTDVIWAQAKLVGIDPDENTPASIFDTELQEEGSVAKLVSKLVRMGYTGAILDDIAYGQQIEDEAWIEFNVNF